MSVASAILSKNPIHGPKDYRVRIAQVVIDVPSRQLDAAFDYVVPADLAEVTTGSFANRPAIGYVTGMADSSPHDRLKSVQALLGGPFFGEESSGVAAWLAAEYLCPLSEAVKLFTPPGATPRAVRHEGANGEAVWELRRAGVGPIDDRWIELAPSAEPYVPRTGAHVQRAILDSLTTGPARIAELAADLGAIAGPVRALERAGAVIVSRRRRYRALHARERSALRHERLTVGQSDALASIDEARQTGGAVIVLDGVTGSGKTEVYLRAIEAVLAEGRSACVLVPEISLTPQTVGRFRSRFGDEVAVLHSRLSPGERYDQWDRVSSGESRVVVGARSALFAPLKDVGLIVIDEEHESSYKQSSAPRYHARDVAARLAEAHNAVLVLGSASPSLESRHQCDTGQWKRVAMPERVTGHQLPPVTVVDLAAEFAAGHRAMFSRPLIAALERVRDAGSKAVLFLNRRGFASFLLCRECGYVPTCDSCSTSLTYHETDARLACHHCGSRRVVPGTCPSCGSPYLRQFGAGTQRVEAELATLFPEWPVVRMDADTTKGKGAHERLLSEFEELKSGVLLGTQMIAKGLDYPDVTLVGVITADVTLNLPDFRAGERTYQLLEQVAGRAGRGEREGEVVIQTYWPDHAAIRAAALHDAETFYREDCATRQELGYPPFGRLANVLIWGTDPKSVEAHAGVIAEALRAVCPQGWTALGPSPAPLSRLKGVWRWHVLIKAPEGTDVPGLIGPILRDIKSPQGVSVAADIDPLDLL